MRGVLSYLLDWLIGSGMAAKVIRNGLVLAAGWLAARTSSVGIDLADWTTLIDPALAVSLALIAIVAKWVRARQAAAGK